MPSPRTRHHSCPSAACGPSTIVRMLPGDTLATTCALAAGSVRTSSRAPSVPVTRARSPTRSSSSPASPASVLATVDCAPGTTSAPCPPMRTTMGVGGTPFGQSTPGTGTGERRPEAANSSSCGAAINDRASAPILSPIHVPIRVALARQCAMPLKPVGTSNPTSSTLMSIRATRRMSSRLRPI